MRSHFNFFFLCLTSLCIYGNASGQSTNCTRPNNFTLSSAGVSSTQVSISWTASSVSAPSILTEYEVMYRQANVNALYSTVANIPVNTPRVATITGLQAGVIYNFKVIARAVCTQGADTDRESNTITVPTSPLAVPAGLNYNNITQNSFTGTWNTVEGAENYQVQINNVQQQPNPGNSKGFTGLDAGKTYSWQVRAMCATCIPSASAFSAPVSVTLVPPNPSGLHATNIQAISLTVNWDAAEGASDYLLDVSPSSSFSSFLPNYQNYPVTGNLRLIAGLTTGTTYYFRVRARNGSGTSGYSSVASATTLTVTNTIGIRGDQSVCPGTPYTYEVDPVYSSYTWTVNGGSVQSQPGQGNNKVTVVWTTGSSQREVIVTTPNGETSALQVYISPPFQGTLVKELSYSAADLQGPSIPVRNLTIDHCASDAACVAQQFIRATLFAALDLGEDYLYGANDFETSMEIEISGYSDYAGNHQTMKETYPLSLDETAPEQILKLDITEKFSQTVRFNVKINSYTPHSLVSNSIRLRVYYKDEYGSDLQTQKETPAAITLNPVNPSPSGTSKITFSWNTCMEFPDYEFQLLRLYNNSPPLAANPASIRTKVNWKEALTLETQSSNRSLTISITEGTGYYAWRVRPIGILHPGGIANPKNWGKWSSEGSFDQGQEVNVNSSEGSHVFYYTQFDENKNWIHGRTFTEGDAHDGSPVRISEKISFANSLEQVKQVQTVMESNETALVTQRVYDFAGRPALSSMVIPVEGKNSFGYINSFMKNESGQSYSAADFDTDLKYNQPGTVKDDNASDHFDYYSQANPDLRIPSADGYPFSRILYSGDGTERVKEQSSPGAIHAIKPLFNESRTVKTYYSGMNDDELIRVLGDEAPRAESVQKITTMDPNRVASVSYIDKEGKTLATCLERTGFNDVNDEDTPLEGLESQHLANFGVKDTIMQSTSWLAHGHQRSRRLSLIKPTNVTLHYQLEKADVEEVCSGYCKTCDYYLVFTIVDAEDPSVVVLSETHQLPPDLCSQAGVFHYERSAALDIGNYIISQKVTSFTIHQDPSNPPVSFLQEQKDSVQHYYQKAALDSLGTLLEMLAEDNVELNAVYGQLGVDINIPDQEVVFQDSSAHVNVGCDTVKVPVYVCTSRVCPRRSDLEFADDLTNSFEFLLVSELIKEYPNGPAIYFMDHNVNYEVEPYSAYDISFDAVVERMVNEGYSCDVLWACWEGIVAGYIFQYKAINGDVYNPGADSIPFDPVEQFFDCAGRQIQGITSTEWSVDHSNPGYRSHPYKVFQYVPGQSPVCENFIYDIIHGPNEIVDGANFGEFTREHWTKFHQCTKTPPGPGEPNEPGQMRDKILRDVAGMTDSCKRYCEYRKESFEQSVIQMFHNDSLYVEGDRFGLARGAWGKEFVPNMNMPLPEGFQINLDRGDADMGEVQCMVATLMNHCQSGCTLTPAYEMIDGVERIVSVGTPEETEAFKHSMTWTFKLDLPENGLCPEDFETMVPGTSVLRRYWDNTLGATAGSNSRLWDIQRSADGGYILAGDTDGSGGHDKHSQARGGKDYWVVKLDENGNFLWDKSFGGINDDHLTSIHVIAGGGGYLLGGTSSSPPILVNLKPGDKTSPHFGEKDYWLVRIDLQGNMLWDKTYGGNYDDELISVQSIIEGGTSRFLLGGNSSSDRALLPAQGNKADAWFGSTVGAGPVPRSAADYWVLKTDLNGNILRQRVLGSVAGSEHLHAIRQATDGMYVVAGYSDGNPHIADPGPVPPVLANLPHEKNQFSIGGNDFWVVKLNQNLNILWQKTIGGTDHDLLFDLEVDTQNPGYILGGYSNSPGSSTIGHKTADNCGGEGDVWVVKLNSAGNTIVWEKTLGGAGAEFPQDDGPVLDITQTFDRGFIVSAISKSDASQSPDECEKSEDTYAAEGNSTDLFDYWLIKLNPGGNIQWDKTVGGVGNDFATSVVEPSPNQFVVAGFSESPTDCWPPPPTCVNCGDLCLSTAWKYESNIGLQDYWVVKLGPQLCDHRDFCFKWDTLHLPIPTPPPPRTCSQIRKERVRSIVEDQINALVIKKVSEYTETYTQQCADPLNINDQFWLEYPQAYHHYTLYYYDRAGNLIKTVPPKGVQTLDLDAPGVRNRLVSPAHTLASFYYYNNQDQLVRQTTPDGGETRFYYNAVGQLRFSQNAQQAINTNENKYTYSKYDNLGRVIEMGVSNEYPTNFSDFLENPQFPSNGTQKTITTYSVPAEATLLHGRTQRYLTNRVSHIKNDDNASTIYSYDPHGNVEWVIQNIPGLDYEIFIAYEYDLISNKVLKVKYNEGKTDQFFHRYSYDSDNRIINVQTSSDQMIWDTDARYEYYLHGPLKRISIGEDKLQGIDYTYTINGWLKGINHAGTDAENDPGKDGAAGDHSQYGKDVFGMQLSYHTGDFNRTFNQSASPFNSGGPGSLDPEGNHNLYNGNISTWSSRLVPPENLTQSDDVTGEQFIYDELNRLLQSNFKARAGSSWNALDDYHTEYSYDANGNMNSLIRNGRDAPLEMDHLTYAYPANTNRLEQVSDIVPANNYMNDLDSTSTYGYDAIGQLISDPTEEIASIEWTAYGKVKKITRTTGSTRPHLEFMYDASGNRIAKKVIPDPVDDTKSTTTYYAYGSDGNVLAIYEKKIESGEELITLIEQPIYGSSRLGERVVSIQVNQSENTPPVTGDPPFHRPDRGVLLLVSSARVAFAELNKGVFSTLETPLKTGGRGRHMVHTRSEDGNILFTAYTTEEHDGKTNVFTLLNEKNEIVQGSEGIISDWRANLATLRNPTNEKEHYLFTIGPQGIPYYHIIDIVSGQFKSVNQQMDTESNYGFEMALIEDKTGAYPGSLYLISRKGNTASIVRFNITKEGIKDRKIVGSFASDAVESGVIQISAGGGEMAIADLSATTGKSNLYIFELSKDHQEVQLKETFTSDQVITSLDFSPLGRFIYYNHHPQDNKDGVPSVYRYGMDVKKSELVLSGKSGVIHRSAQGTMFIASKADNILYEIVDPDRDGDIRSHKISEIPGASWELQDVIADIEE